ncbi:hypothetical protein MIND_00412400 [Mycena indigotica]|uniref:Uncharacterized protein n=1 Tax=Mycena indigotica TaxID=2126181 RepID=A0A8H6WBB7_9AGAR|nr:uncharacterized protein MIND_00412400 [Mycena indigotica]KAF7306219.1 hypothetical protein MIND_00412400 [Mycena indigotica]
MKPAGTDASPRRLPYVHSQQQSPRKRTVFTLLLTSMVPTSLLLLKAKMQLAYLKTKLVWYQGYHDPSFPMRERVMSVGLWTGIAGGGGFALGALSAAIPRAVEAAIHAKRKTAYMPPLRLFRLGVLSHAIALGSGTAAVPSTGLLIQLLGIPSGDAPQPKLLGWSVNSALTVLLSALWALPVRVRIDRAFAARGVRMDKAADNVSTALAVGIIGLAWTSHKDENPGQESAEKSSMESRPK